jgi:hypothetical protein
MQRRPKVCILPSRPLPIASSVCRSESDSLRVALQTRKRRRRARVRCGGQSYASAMTSTHRRSGRCGQSRTSSGCRRPGAYCIVTKRGGAYTAQLTPRAAQHQQAAPSPGRDLQARAFQRCVLWPGLIWLIWSGSRQPCGLTNGGPSLHLFAVDQSVLSMLCDMTENDIRSSLNTLQVRAFAKIRKTMLGSGRR